MRKMKFIVLGLASTVFFACQNDELPIYEEPTSKSLEISSKSGTDASELITADYLDAMNVELASQGLNYRVAMAEYITVGSSNEAGQTVLAKDVGNKQLSFDFVPFDSRRSWSAAGGANITYAIDQTTDAVPFGGSLTGAETDAIIENAIQTWEDVNCSDLGLTRNSDFGLDIGVVAFLNGLGGTTPFIFADVQHAGFRDINFAGGVLGVAFTFGFNDGSGFTDINGDGKLDVSFREIYYDPSWIWGTTGVTDIDLESVAVHEMGHGLSQAHFGNISIKNDGSLKASPRAVMNALYNGAFRDLKGSDNGGHCSNWANWPQN